MQAPMNNIELLRLHPDLTHFKVLLLNWQEPYKQAVFDHFNHSPTEIAGRKDCDLESHSYRGRGNVD